MAGSWPNSQDYNEAVQNPGFSFSDSELQGAEAVCTELGLPQAFSGGFADVYQLQAADGRSWAVKCFTKRVESRRERYAAISGHLQQAGLPFTVGFEFVEQGIRVQGEWYPILKMDWVEGQTLANFVRDNLSRPKLLKSLLKIWLKVEPRLHRARMAHGDLQHGNVMLIPGRTEDKLSLKLIDYDGLWIGPLHDQPSGEVGHPSYQHPERLQRATYSADVDRFPHFVIAAALRCLSTPSGAELWEKYDTGENLLFSQSDFARPEQSDLFKELWSSGDAEIRLWTGHLILAARSKLEATPRLARLVERNRIAGLAPDDRDTVGRLLGVRAGAKAAPSASSEVPPLAADIKLVADEAPTGGTKTPEWLKPADQSLDASDMSGVDDALSAETRQSETSEPAAPTVKTPHNLRPPAHRWRRFVMAGTGLVAVTCVAAAAFLFSGSSGPSEELDETLDIPVVQVEPAVLVVAGTVAGQMQQNNGPQMELVWCPAGDFTMGSPNDETGRFDNENQVDVTLTRGFWLGRTEVTQQQWQDVMQTTPWQGQSNVLEQPDCPATCLSWNDAVEFCEKLTQEERAAGRLNDQWKYTLPTEAQWEYACRSGGTTVYHFGSASTPVNGYAWVNQNTFSAGEQYAHPVAKKAPNAWGLHDLHGNVSEWCLDGYEDQLSGEEAPAPAEGTASLVNRGGNWMYQAQHCRSASRSSATSSKQSETLGFRLALIPLTDDAAIPPVTPTEPILAENAPDQDAPEPDDDSTAGELQPFLTTAASAGDEQSPNGLGLKLVWCPPGSFKMGSPPDEPNRGKDENQVDVTLTQGFWMGKYEVTQQEWRDVMATEPWKGGSVMARNIIDRAPARYVSWDDAVKFCQKLTTSERNANRLPDDWEYTLPTEAQWEYACRAGTTTAFNFGGRSPTLSAHAWWGGEFGDGNAKAEPYAHEVGQKRANAWNLHDMHGNVREWCSDSYTSTLPGGTDPRRSSSVSVRVNRGGSWEGTPQFARSAARLEWSSRGRDKYTGFRVAAVPSTSESAPVATPGTPLVAGVQSGTRAGEEQTDNSLNMKLVWCPPGKFTMGSPPDEVGRENHEDQVDVTLTQGFWMGKYEVTQREWRDVMGTEPWKGKLSAKDGDRFPAMSVTWREAVAFSQKLTASERAAGRLPDDWEYTLPTEAQWEYACRAGTTTTYSFGNNTTELGQYAWFKGNTVPGKETGAHEVGQRLPNAWGLHDTHGNVFEWCRDRRDSEKRQGGIDPLGPSSGTGRVSRGGAWFSGFEQCRSAFCDGFTPDFQNSGVGFRVLRGTVSSSVPTASASVKPPPVALAPPGTRAGDEKSTNSLNLKMVWCPPGKFTMGSPASEAGRQTNEAQVTVTLSQGFWMGKYEVTQKIWRDVMGTEPWRSKNNARIGDRFAASYISWDDAVDFCQKLTTSERAAGQLPDDQEYTLPTEAQWEYACRAGTTTAYSFGDNARLMGQYSWFNDNAARAGQGFAHEVGWKRPNAWNLHDMHGNVSELCLDTFGGTLPGGTDPKSSSKTDYRVYRGGCCWSGDGLCRSAFRGGITDSHSVYTTGFRVIRSSVLTENQGSQTRP